MTGSPRHLAARIVKPIVLFLVVAAIATTAPVAIHHDEAGLRLEPAAALAKSGKGKDGSRDDDDDDDREEDDDDRDDRDDDDRDDDDRDDRDDGGRDRNRDRNHDDRNDKPRRSGSDDDPRTVVRVELTGTGINVIYHDRSREVLSNGMYRREDASGRVLDIRAATGADLVRLRALAGGRAVPATAATTPEADPVMQGHPKLIRLRGNDVIVDYTDGWTEAVERGRYRLTDRYGHIAVDRPATGDDRARLRALAGR